MKVLWYEITIPKRYKADTAPIAGWQDSLQEIVMQNNDIELYVVFEGIKGMTVKFIDGVTYIPIIPNMSLFGKKVIKLFNQQYTVDKLLPFFIKTVEEVKPDVIQIFGTEWGLGEIANHTDIPVVIHLMGCVASYDNAAFPPGYSILDRIKTAGINPINFYRLIRGIYYNKRWKNVEQNNFQAVSNYMGRTAWDKAMCELFHPGCNYFYCSEALRLSFVTNTQRWSIPQNNRLQIMTIGCTTHWKGMDTVLKTANILKKYGINFEWKIAGKMRTSLKNEIERKENLKFTDCNVNILGFVNSDDLIPLLLSSNIYVHTAYIDNSPNTICEAQYLGLPIISTYVGGIPSLIQNEKEGILVPANDPYMLAHEIIELSNDRERQQKYSQATSLRARERHDPANIYRDLLSCYHSLIHNKSQK